MGGFPQTPVREAMNRADLQKQVGDMDKHFSRNYNGAMFIITCTQGIPYVDVNVNTLSLRQGLIRSRHSPVRFATTVPFATDS